MIKPQDFDTTQGFSDFKALPAGGYICQILKVEECKSSTGKDMIKIYLDIADGDFKEYYTNLYKSDTRQDKKWGCVVNQLVYDNNGATNRGFKSFVTSVEESNKNFKLVWGDKFAGCFKGTFVGVLFGREEYLNSQGSKKWITKPRFFRGVDTIKAGDYTVPEDKPLTSTDNLPAGFDEFVPPQHNSGAAGAGDDLPF